MHLVLEIKTFYLVLDFHIWRCRMNWTLSAKLFLASNSLHNHPRAIERGLQWIFYKTEMKIWAVGFGLGWTVLKKVWADYEQLLKGFFSCFQGQFFFIIKYCSVRTKKLYKMKLKFKKPVFFRAALILKFECMYYIRVSYCRTRYLDWVFMLNWILSLFDLAGQKLSCLDHIV